MGPFKYDSINTVPCDYAWFQVYYMILKIISHGLMYYDMIYNDKLYLRSWIIKLSSNFNASYERRFYDDIQVKCEWHWVPQ